MRAFPCAATLLLALHACGKFCEAFRQLGTGPVKARAAAHCLTRRRLAQAKVDVRAHLQATLVRQKRWQVLRQHMLL